MKTGKTLVELAQKLEADKALAKDFIVPVSKIRAEVELDAPVPGSGSSLLLSFGGKQVKPNGWAHNQLANYLDVPRAYYDRIHREKPELLADMVNHGLDRAPQKDSRMIRTLGRDARALLSSKFRRLDSYDLLDAVLPAMVDNKFEVVSAELTDKRLYLKALTPRIQQEIKPGDVVQAGLIISSSDVGAGALKVEPLVYRLICKNGMIGLTAIRKFHVGRNQAGDDFFELLSDKTKELSDAAFWAQVRDLVLVSMKPEIFQNEVERLRLAAGEKIENYDLESVVELSMKRVGITGEKTKQSIAAYLANGADGAGLTKWGLINGFTHAAQAEHVGYDESVELERAGGAILELPRADWRKIAAGSEVA